METKEQLEKAKTLIQAKRYNEARQILIHTDHPTADKWLARLDEIAPVSTQPRKTSTVTGIAVLVGVGALVLIAILLALLVTQRNVASPTPTPNETQIFEQILLGTLPPTVEAAVTSIAEVQITLTVVEAELRGLMHSPLSAYCQFLEEKSRGACGRWADEVVTLKLNEAMVCYEEYDTVFDTDNFTGCLLFFGISPIGDTVLIPEITVERMQEKDYVRSLSHLLLYCQEESSRNDDWCYAWSMMKYDSANEIVVRCVSTAEIWTDSAGCFRRGGLVAGGGI